LPTISAGIATARVPNFLRGRFWLGEIETSFLVGSHSRVQAMAPGPITSLCFGFASRFGASVASLGLLSILRGLLLTRTRAE